MTDGGRIPSKVDGLMERIIDDEIIVLSREGNVLHSFSDTARFIWSQIDGKRTIEDLTAVILDEYQVDESSARTDLSRFLASLEELSLISER
jgi:hypothetical protein